MTIPATIAFILRAPPISYVSNIYYLPFNGVVWMCSISLVILSTCVIAFTLKSHWSHDESVRRLSTTDFILFAIASSCQMGSDIMTKILSARISMVCCVKMMNSPFFFNRLLFSFLFSLYFLLRSCSFILRSQQILWLCCNRRRNQFKLCQIY